MIVQRGAYALPAVALCVLLPLSFATTAAADSTQSDGAELTVSETRVGMDEAAVVHFRRSVGFDDSPEALESARAADNDSVDEFGVPLTDQELRELLLRDEIISANVAIVRTVLGSKLLAGVWMDNIGGGFLTVATTGSADAVRATLEGRLSHLDRLRVVHRPHSLKSLSTLSRQILELADVQNQPVTAVRLDERQNILQIVSDGDRGALLAWVRASFGEQAPVEVVMGTTTLTGTTFPNSPPFRGGQRMLSQQGYTCTSAFTASGPAGLYVITAGHCSRSGNLWYQGGTVVGTADRSDVTDTDALRIPISAQAAAVNEVTLSYVPAYATEARYRTITSAQDAASDAVGQISCITGQNFDDLRCGEIVTRQYAVNLNDEFGRVVSYSLGREVDADCDPGDSGGPALRSQQARGIISVKVNRGWDGNDTCVYVHIEGAVNQLLLDNVLFRSAVWV